MRILVSLLVIGLSACGDNPAQHMGGLRTELAAARSEVTQHDANSQAAGDMSAMLSELERHGASMERIRARMDEHMSGMMGGDMMGRGTGCCSGSMPSMMTTRTELDARREQHRSLMMGAADVTAAHAEAQAYDAAMQGMLEHMDGDMSACTH